MIVVVSNYANDLGEGISCRLSVSLLHEKGGIVHEGYEIITQKHSKIHR